MNIISATITYQQEADSCSDRNTQEIEISVRDAGGGLYVVIKTDEWAINAPSELSDLIEDFRTRILSPKITNP